MYSTPYFTQYSRSYFTHTQRSLSYSKIVLNLPHTRISGFDCADNLSKGDHPKLDTTPFLDDTLEVDVSIVGGTIFGILGSEKLSAQPKPEARVCGKLNTIYK